ncbi:MAG: hypothetical protein ABL973_15645 [Micropepsaceae bacterium]
MSYLKSLAFGAVALVAASFSTMASAKADSFGVYVGSNGFGVQVSNYNGGYGSGYYGNGGYYDPCLNKNYRRHHRHCWNNGGSGYNNGYYPQYNYGNNYGYRPHLRRTDRHDRRWDRDDRRGQWRDNDRGHDRRGNDRGRWNNNGHRNGDNHNWGGHNRH